MVNTKQKPMKEVNSLLFGDEHKDTKQSEPLSTESSARLLQQKNAFFDAETLAPVPYYKKPSVQLIAVLTVAIPFGWMFISAFNGGEPQADPKAHSTSEQEKERTGALQRALEQEKQKNRSLALESGLKSQQIEVVPVQKTKVPKPLPPPKPVRPQPTPVQRSVTPRAVPVRTSAAITPKTIALLPEPEPEPEPMEQWLAQANQGYYVTSSSQSYDSPTNQSVSESYSDTSNYIDTPAANPDVTQTYSSQTSNYDSSTNQSASEAYSETSNYDNPTNPSASERYSEVSNYNNRANIPVEQHPLAEETQRASSDSQEISQIYTSSSAQSLPTQSMLTAQNVSPTSVPTTESYQNRQSIPEDSSYSARQNITPTQTQSPSDTNIAQQSNYPTNIPSLDESTNQVLDIGDSGEAVLETGIAWSEQQEIQPNRLYLLRLKEGFKNESGEEVLPEGTRLIAKVTQTSDSGLFAMEVVYIVGADRQKIPVRPGAMQIVAEDGSPLKADLKQKGEPDFLAQVGAIVAPGVERAMNSVADSSSSLILEEGDRSLIRTNGGDGDPIAAGVSGIANGATEVLSRQLDSEPTQSVASYFQFDSDETVTVQVNEELIFSQ
jgi:hypothetical protein